MIAAATLAIVAALPLLAQAQFVPPLEHRLTQKQSTFTGGLSDMTATAVDGNRIFLYGGCRQQTTLYGVCTAISDEAFFYYPSEDRLEEVSGTGSTPLPRYRHAAAYVGGLVYVIGGISAQDPSNDLNLETLPVEIDVFDTANLEWSRASATLPVGWKDGTAFAVGGKAYFTAGWDANYTTLNVHTYQIENPSSLTQLDGHDVPRGDAGSAVVGDRAFVLGGYASDAHLNTVEIFDALTLDWEPMDSEMRLARGDKAVAAMQGRLYVFGGQSLQVVEAEAVPSIEIYNVERQEWMEGGRMPDARFRFAAAAVGSVVYCFGGQVQPTDETSFALMDSIFAYEESTAGLYSNPTITLHGSGTTNPSNFFWHVIDIFDTGTRLPIKMTYRAVGSSTGQKEFLGDEDSAFLPYTQFGSGDIPLKREDWEEVSKHYAVAQFPFAFGAVSVYVHIPELNSGGSDRRVVLPACALARIFKGDVTRWSELAGEDGDNSWLRGVDQPIQAVHRVAGSSSTSGLTTFLNAECPDEWPADLVGSSIDWPCDTAGTCAGDAGSGGIQGYLRRTPYSIGYLSVSHGYPAPLREATFVNANGDKVQASDAGIQAAANAFEDWPDSVLGDFSGVTLINTAGEGAWPIVLVSYLYVRQDLTNLGASAALLQAFLSYVLDQGQELMRSYDFVPLTDDVAALCEDGLEDLVLPGDVEEFDFEGSTPEAIGGAGPYVISAKREVFAQQAIEDLQATVGQLEARESLLSAEMTLATRAVRENKDLREDVDTAHAIAVAAIVLAVLNCFVLGAVLFCLSGIRSAVRASRQSRNQNNGIKQPGGNTDVELSQQSLDSNNSASAAVRAVNVV